MSEGEFEVRVGECQVRSGQISVLFPAKAWIHDAQAAQFRLEKQYTPFCPNLNEVRRLSGPFTESANIYTSWQRS